MFTAFKLSPGFWLPLLAWLGWVEIPDPTAPNPRWSAPMARAEPTPIPKIAGTDGLGLFALRRSDEPRAEEPAWDPSGCCSSGLGQAARVVPFFVDGEAMGYRLYSIRPNSIYAKVGLQSGDVVSRINGFEVTSPDKALELYSGIKNASVLRVQIIRRGRPMTLRYRIR